jgi:hypothetical protein
MTHDSHVPEQPAVNEEKSGSRIAKISRFENKPLGACIYLSVSDLRSLGIPIEDTISLAYRIDEKDHQITFTEVNRERD